MKQRIVHGGMVDFLTPDELVNLIPRPAQLTRIREKKSLQLSGAGAGGPFDVYKVPIGYEFALRRVVFTLTGAAPSDPNTGNVLLNAAGKWIAYLVGGELAEYAQPQYGSAIQVPGVQTWAREQGPYLRNGETFGVQVAGLTASLSLSIYAEGLLRRPADTDNWES